MPAITVSSGPPPAASWDATTHTSMRAPNILEQAPIDCKIALFVRAAL
jgi:hypothetical protein